MKKHLRIVIAAILVLACVGALLGFAACDKEKQEATITAEATQNFVYDGQVHNVVAELSHDEAELQYDPQQGFTEIGMYVVTITAPATENYKAPTPVVVTVNILDPADIAADELADKIMAGVPNFDVAQNMGVDVGVDLSYKPATGEGWGYAVAIKGNLDVNNLDKTQLTISVTDTLASANVVTVTYDAIGDAIYLAIGADEKYVLEGLDVLGMLNLGEVASTNVTLNTYLSMILGALGSNCTAVDENTYTMDFNLKETLGGTLGDLIGAILPALGEDLVNTIYGLFGATDWDSFVNALPDLSGTIEVKFADNKLTSVALKDVSYKDGDEQGTVQASISPFTISNSQVQIAMPDKAEYTALDILNFTLNGSIILSNDNTPYIEYKLNIMSDLDIAEVVKLVNGDETADLSKLGKFYLRIFHICDDSCGAYCDSKIEAGEGSILELAYDSAVNENSVFAVAGLRNLISVEFIQSMGGLASIIGSKDMAASVIPEYTAITIDLESLLGGLLGTSEAAPATANLADEGGIDIGAILGALTIGGLDGQSNFSIGVNLATLLPSLGVDAGTVGTISGIFGEPVTATGADGSEVTENKMEQITISFSGLRFFSTDLSNTDLINTIVKVKDASIEGDKTFETGGIFGNGVSPGIAESAKTWEIVMAEDGKNPKMYTQLDLSFISQYEIESQLIGNEVFFDVTTLDGSLREDVPAKIRSIKGIDYSKVGVAQDVTLVVTLPQTLINKTITDALAGTIDLYSLITTDVPVTITIAEVSNVTFEESAAYTECNGELPLLSVWNPEIATATMKYTKTAGDRVENIETTVSMSGDFSAYTWTPYSGSTMGYVYINDERIAPRATLIVNPGSVVMSAVGPDGSTFEKTVTFTDPYTEKTMTATKTEVTVGSSLSANLEFTLSKEDGTQDTAEFRSTARWASAPFVSFPEAFRGEGAMSISTSSFTYEIFPVSEGVDPATVASIETAFYVTIFGQKFEQAITLNNVETSYKGTVSDLVVNGLTATFTVTIENDDIGYGSGYTGLTVAIEDYSTLSTYTVKVTDCTTDVSVTTIDLANDMQGNKVTFNVTVTSSKAGKGRFYIRLYNGEASTANRVAQAYTATIEFTDPTTEA